MRSITQCFTIHPVGQGLFYSGIIETKLSGQEEKFRLIFDCGSLTSHAGADEVNRFRKEDFQKETDYIDLLVISHFDADHVNYIKNLLSTTRKVRKVVMPFVEFEERLFLVLRYIEHKNARLGEDDLGPIRFILNPEGELGPHLSDDDATSIFLITSDPDSPTGNAETNNVSGSEFVPEGPGLEFWFKRQERRLTTEEKNSFLFQFTLIPESRIGIVKDSVTGDIHFKSAEWVALMEFIFYKREVSGNEKKFYREVFDSFCNRYKINRHDRSINLVNAIVDALRTIAGATEIKKCYSAAKKKMPGVKITRRDILNMNATALCMLHRNLDSVFRIFSDSSTREYRHWGPYILRLEKPFGSNSIEFKREAHFEHFWDYSHVPFEEHRRQLFEECYPNVLLTSDSYLKLPEEADRFLVKYRPYHNKYWLFQIPHHGSRNNTDRNVMAQLPGGISKFINYGIRHKFEKNFSHPHLETIQELLVAGQSERVHAVNEFAGLSFYFHLSTK